MNQTIEIATLGAGCFWCVEAIYPKLKGVIKVQSGYSGGIAPNPTYKDICSGNSGYAEVCQIEFDHSIISYKDLLDVFWKIHDPTSLNQQGNDIGPQYKSVIFYHSNTQKEIAEYSKNKLEALKRFSNSIVTEISPYTNFYKAEDYHQDYFELHKKEPYCQFVILPKVEIFKQLFKSQLKKTED